MPASGNYSSSGNYSDDYEDDARHTLLGYDELNYSNGQTASGIVDSRTRLWSRANAPLLVAALSVAFFTSTLVSLVGPFLPAELHILGATDSTVGITFAVYPLALFVCSPLACWLCIKFGQTPVILLGVLLEGGLAVVAAFFVQLAPTDPSRIALLISLRLLQGVGGALSYTAVCARLADCYPNNLGEVMGLQESIAGVGYTLGPVMGALLYNWGGFPLPFLVMGGLLLCTLLFLPTALHSPKDDKTMRISFPSVADYGDDDYVAAPDGEAFAFADGSDSERAEPKEITWWGILTDMSVFTGFSATVLSGVGIGFIVPTLQAHLSKLLGLDTVGVGLMFSLIAATYIGSSAVSGWAGDRFGHRAVMVIGLLTLTVCYLLIGPAPFLSYILPDLPWVNWAIQVTALAGIGIGVGLALVPAMPHMLIGLRTKGATNPSELSASLFSSAYSMGEGLGPLMGGMLSQKLGFEWAAVAVACSQLLLALIFLLEAAVNGSVE